jgi:peptidoglycan hydrolase FlgJ
MDLVTDVLKQADAAKLKVATRFIEDFARRKSDKSRGAEFENLSVDARRADVLMRTEFKPAKDQSRVPGHEADALLSEAERKRTARGAVMMQLETVLATKLVEGMMPKSQSQVYGEGTVGEIWRGLHIETMGKSLAENGLFAIDKVEARKLDHGLGKPLRTKSIVPFAG